MPLGKHTMVGPGGEIRVPKSESDQITRAIHQFTHGDFESGLATLKALREQVQGGYHRNALRFLAGTAIGKIGDDVHSVRYRHAKDKKHYQHDFHGQVDVYAVERAGKRDLLLTHRDGAPLWDEF